MHRHHLTKDLFFCWTDLRQRWKLGEIKNEQQIWSWQRGTEAKLWVRGYPANVSWTLGGRGDHSRKNMATNDRIRKQWASDTSRRGGAVVKTIATNDWARSIFDASSSNMDDRMSRLLKNGDRRSHASARSALGDGGEQRKRRHERQSTGSRAPKTPPGCKRLSRPSYWSIASFRQLWSTVG